MEITKEMNPMKNVLEWLESTVKSHGDKVAYMDQQDAMTFEQVSQKAKAIGSFLAENTDNSKKPVAVLCARWCQTPAVFLGVVYSGRAYAPLDANLPADRLRKILKQMKPAAVVTDEMTESIVKDILSGENELQALPCYIAERMAEQAVLEEKLASIRREMISQDPLYIIYTSGSTGMPKGVVTSHDSLMRYIDAYCQVMGIEEMDRLGNQSPLDYIAAIRDIYLPMKTACSTVIIPKEYFMAPEMLFNYLNEWKVTSVGWSVSAFTIPYSLGALEEIKLETLSKICFSGSVMPAKCLRAWQQALPEARFVNQYGPTEATASCSYYVVDHLVDAEEILPIGRAYQHYRIFVLKEDDTLAETGELGEICVTGPCLALGYYNDPERTANSFVLNPLNQAFPERMYRTGDIGLQREDGLLEFHGRRDRQVKHMGHRVELDEIEVAANQIEDLEECCCIYQKEKEKLHLFYTGNVDKRTLQAELSKSLPGFMVPRGVKQLDIMPKLANGKIDMNALKAETEKRRRRAK